MSDNGAAATMGQRPLVWLNVVCLDAPLVAVTWQCFFSQIFRVNLPIASVVALFLTAWLIYLIDRLADSLSLSRDSAKTVREEFCLRHKNAWQGFILAIAPLDAAFVLWRLDRDLLIAGIFLGAIAISYLIINFAFSRLWAAVPLKEIAVGFLFAAGTLISLIPQLSLATPAGTRSSIAFAAFSFAGLCSLNCMSIAVWERELDRTQARHSIATRWRRTDILVRILLLILTGTSLFSGILRPQLWPLFICLALSSTLLIGLHFAPIARDQRTALADLVLLTPLAWLLVGKLG